MTVVIVTVVTVVTVAVGTVVIVTYLSKNNLTPWQLMRCSHGRFCNSRDVLLIRPSRREASREVPVTLLSYVCGHSLRLGMCGWSSVALGVGNQSNDWWWMIDDGWWMMSDGWLTMDDGWIMMDDGWWMMECRNVGM